MFQLWKPEGKQALVPRPRPGGGAGAGWAAYPLARSGRARASLGGVARGALGRPIYSILLRAKFSGRRRTPRGAGSAAGGAAGPAPRASAGRAEMERLSRPGRGSARRGAGPEFLAWNDDKSARRNLFFFRSSSRCCFSRWRLLRKTRRPFRRRTAPSSASASRPTTSARRRWRSTTQWSRRRAHRLL